MRDTGRYFPEVGHEVRRLSLVDQAEARLSDVIVTMQVKHRCAMVVGVLERCADSLTAHHGAHR